MTLHDRDRTAIIHTYDRSDILLTHGKGCRLYDAEDNEYLDLTAGLGVNALGHAHAAVLNAVQAQMEQYIHVSNTYVQEPQVELAEKLLQMSPGMGGVFFCNSGAEAVEGAIKLVRKWGAANGKTDLVGFTNAFHGRTTGALALMSTEKYREGFGPFIDGCLHVPFNDVEALRESVSSNTAAVFLEFVQGEGGVVPATKEFVAALEELRSQYGFLIVADEIQAGIGRTGKFYSYQWFGIVPDVVCAAKAIGGGFPLGAVMMKTELRDVYGTGRHGSTFGGNPVACAAGAAVLDTIRHKALMDHVNFIAALVFEYFFSAQSRYPDLIADVRGWGFMIGVEFSKPVPELRDMFAQRGVLVNVTQGNVLRLLPPLILPKEEALQAVRICEEIFTALDEKLHAIPEQG